MHHATCLIIDVAFLRYIDAGSVVAAELIFLAPAVFAAGALVAPVLAVEVTVAHRIPVDAFATRAVELALWAAVGVT